MIFYLAYDWLDVNRPRVKIIRQNNANNEEQLVFEDQETDFFLHQESTYQKIKDRDVSFWAFLTLVIYLIFLIAYASMYIGSNSIDQVLFAMTLGYGIFCVWYYFLKDIICERTTLVSEKMLPNATILGSAAFHVVLIVLFIILARVFYYYENKGYIVNPLWKAEHAKNCGQLPFPSFFDKELLRVYNFLYLDLGLMIGLVVDALLLGGTRIDYNQLRRAEQRNPLVGFILRLFITVCWVLLCVWGGVYFLGLLIHQWLFVLAIPYFICGLGLTTFLKYIFKLLGATRPDIYPIPDVKAVELRKAN